MIEQFVQLSPETDFYLRTFIIVAAVLAIPVVIAVCLLCFKAFLLLHNLTEFARVVRSELTPVLKDVRQIAEALEGVAAQASGNLKRLQNLANNVGPQLGQGVQNLVEKLQDILEPYIGSFGRRRYKRSASTNTTAQATPTNVETTF